MLPILRRAQHLGKVLLGRHRVGRQVTVFPDDIFLVSYPRSGNTWTRFLIGNLIYDEEPITFANIESRIPEIYLFNNRHLLGFPRPRVLKSHEYFDPRYKNVIYIVRDPRDVAVSVYHYSIKRRDIPETCPMEEFVPRFIAGEFFRDWGTWEEHITSWHAVRNGKPGFLFLRYEDMLANPEAELAKIATFLKLESTPQRLRRAVELSTAENMRKLEKTQSKDWELTSKTRQDKPFVRQARAATWRDELSGSAAARIENSWGGLMRSLGYELSASLTALDSKQSVSASS